MIVYYYTIMSEFEKRHLERELKHYTARNFVRPAECRELCLKIEDYKKRFNFVPNTAYSLLSQYNSKQNSLLYRDYINHY